MPIEKLRDRAEERLGIAKDSDKPMTQKEIGMALKDAWHVNPPVACAACHR